MLPTSNYLERIRISQSPGTLSFYKVPLLKFAGMFPDATIASVTEDTVYNYLSRLSIEGYAQWTVHNHWRVLMHFFRKNGRTLDVVAPRYTAPLVDSYTSTQLSQLFSAATPEEKIIFKFFLVSGAREGEVVHATDKSLDLDGHLFKVMAQPAYKWEPKTHEARNVPLPDGVLELVKGRSGLLFPNRNGRPQKHFLKMLKILAKRSGQDGNEWTLHRFRRTFATFHHENGVSANQIRLWLGHRRMETTLLYLAASDLRSEKTRGMVNSTFGGL